MKPTAAAALVAVLCLFPACEVQKSAHAPTAPILEAESDGATPVPNAGYPHDGDELVAYIAAKYPERLLPTADYDARARDMEFIRDRMVEAGICGGMDLARNLKRGVGPLSMDAIAWRPDGVTVQVVDIAASWDAFWEPMRLQWLIVGGPPGWDPIEAPACN
jgi:hypothetical protein